MTPAAGRPRGRFITVEGGEGVGKSTQLGILHDTLVTAGLEVVMTREPGGTPRAERLRELLLAPTPEPMPAVCELLLMFAARSSHLENVIRPALARGAWVVCDRFTDATYAYQGGARGMPIDHIRALERMVQGELRPDLTLLLDAPVDLALERARRRNQGADADRFELERAAFFEKVRATYLERARAEPARFRLVDAGESLAAVSAAVRQLIEDYVAEVLR